jgi:flavin-binding protein dodecin
LLSGLVSLAVLGGGAYLYVQKDTLIEQSRERVTAAITEAITEALPSLVDAAVPGVPEITGPAVPSPTMPF